MKMPSWLATALIGSLLSTPAALAGQAVQPPSGWSLSQDRGKQIYRPNDLAVTDSFTLTIDSPAWLDAGDMQRWFLERVKSDSDQRGPFEETEHLQRAALGILSLERVYRKDTRVWDVTYIAFPLADHRVLFCSTASNMRDPTAYVRYVHAGGRICGQTARSFDKPDSPVK
jgi:hypothetical protein